MYCINSKCFCVCIRRLSKSNLMFVYKGIQWAFWYLITRAFRSRLLRDRNLLSKAAKRPLFVCTRLYIFPNTSNCPVKWCLVIMTSCKNMFVMTLLAKPQKFKKSNFTSTYKIAFELVFLWKFCWRTHCVLIVATGGYCGFVRTRFRLQISIWIVSKWLIYIML